MAAPKLKKDWQAAASTLGLQTTGTKAQVQERVTQFGYNATVDKGRRQAPQKRVKHESLILKPKDRKKLNATAQDQIRNHSLVAWMVRKHLDYVSKFHVSIRTGHEDVDALLNRILKWHGSPKNLDIAQRLGRDEFFRMFELEKVTNGDSGIIKLADVKLQGLESDLIAKTSDYKPEDHGGIIINPEGLEVDPSTGRRIRFAVANRGGSNGAIQFDHLELAENVIFDGYWTRQTSQYRGVSPLSTAINMVQDIHAGFEYNAVKAAVHALFGVAIMRDSGPSGELGGAAGATSETAGAASTASGSDLDLNPRAINVLDMNQGDTVDIIESKTPSTEFVNGSYLFIQIAMLALDIPVTSFDSRRSSFSARIADLNEYEVSVDSKRTKNRYVRREYSDWLLAQIWGGATEFSADLLRVAGAAKMDLFAIQEAIEWIPAGSPWLDKKKQIEGDKLGIEIGVDNVVDAARRKGGDFFRNIDKQEQAIKYAVDHKVPLTVASTTGVTIDQLITNAVQAGMQPDDQDEEPSDADE